MERSKQRFVLFWVTVAVTIVFALLAAFVVVDGRQADALQRARINAQIATPVPYATPGRSYP